ncbi:MAG TPA: hypothetical protein VMT38_07120 [Terracidiphilus sp.]|nr:hypothetical protein [Terracidiphilus sp.]
MNTLRSVIRRGYTVAQAGYFTVTSPNRWFSASQFPERFPGLSRPKISSPADSNAMPAQTATTLQRTETAPPQFELIGPRQQNHRLLRFALVVLGAVFLALVGLWAAGDTPSPKHWTW